MIGGLAYFLLGPKKMGEAGRTLGKTLRELRRQRDELTAMLMQDPEREEPSRVLTLVTLFSQDILWSKDVLYVQQSLVLHLSPFVDLSAQQRRCSPECEILREWL